ncbi:uncharacterized protein CG5098-like [Coccinella septempunctata]|uniref:uncharacterized protein CG5098-like n=1 Tax=Coccinella septempunctata TaxID=41139 RepID=UPI001D08EE40|nr:uncharacterized protein CG5098-like [Coccinella septempunctata]
MQIAAIFLVISCTISFGLSQGHRGSFPPRGPPRPPPYPGFVKKWQHLQKMHLRGPPPQMRPRPIPMHSLPQKSKKPFPPNSLNRYFQSTPSIRPFWNSPPTTYRPPTEQSLYVQPTEKYSFVHPKQKTTSSIQKEYDFHIQTNQIPSGISSTLLNPIQQVGEKGPIHTIPAPNLSPADRPANIEHVRPQAPVQQYIYEPEQQFQHEYHVTEASEPVKYFRNQQQPLKNVQYYTQNIPGPAPTAQTPQQSSNHNEIQFKSQNTGAQSQENQNKYYKVVQNVQHSNRDSDDIPHHQFLQNIPDLELLLSENSQKTKDQNTQQGSQHQQLLVSEVTHQQQPQQGEYNIHPLFTADQSFVKEFQRLQGQEKPVTLDLNPEFQSFNYNEQDYQKQLSKSSLVSAGYNLDYEPEASEIVGQTISRSTNAEQSKDNFDSNDDDTNDVEQHSTSNAESSLTEEMDEPGGYYSSLPNKEVADALASLQAAGKINSNLMKLSNRGSNRDKAIEIFVAEVSDDSKPEDSYQQDYEQLGNDEEEASDIVNASFGAKIKPKRN